MEGDSPEFPNQSLEAENIKSLDTALEVGDIRGSLMPLALALQSKGEPVRVGIKEIPGFQDKIVAYTSEEKKEEIDSIVKLLTLSPQHVLLDAALNAGRGNEYTKLVNDVLIGNETLSEKERALFDSNFVGHSTRQLLYPPFEISDELRSLLKRAAAKNYKNNDVDLGALFKASLVRDGDRVASPHKDSGIKSGFKKLLGKLPVSKDPVGVGIMQKMYEQAYDNLITRVGGRAFLKDHHAVYHPEEIRMKNDYMNPLLLMFEELEQRGFDSSLFRIIDFGDMKESQDGLDDYVTPIIDEKTKDASIDLRYDPSFVVLRDCYSRGLAWQYFASIKGTDGSSPFEFLKEEYEESVEAERREEEDFDPEEELDQDESLEDPWKDTIFTDEERKQLVAWSIQQSRIYYEQRYPGLNNLNKAMVATLEKEAEAVKQLNIKPPDQPTLRRLIKTIVDNYQNKDAADINT